MPTNQPKKAPQHDALISLFVQLLGVGAFALIAGTSDEMGKIVVILMAGFMVVWAISHADLLKKLVGKL